MNSVDRFILNFGDPFIKYMPVIFAPAPLYLVYKYSKECFVFQSIINSTKVMTSSTLEHAKHSYEYRNCQKAGTDIVVFFTGLIVIKAFSDFVQYAIRRIDQRAQVILERSREVNDLSRQIREALEIEIQNRNLDGIRQGLPQLTRLAPLLNQYGSQEERRAAAAMLNRAADMLPG